MERFIARENIRRYNRMLTDTSDEAKKATLRQLLRDEERRLAVLEAGTLNANEQAHVPLAQVEPQLRSKS